MTDREKDQKTLRKRAKKAIKKKNCSPKKAFEISREYAKYLEQVEVDAPCMTSDERIEREADFII